MCLNESDWKKNLLSNNNLLTKGQLLKKEWNKYNKKVHELRVSKLTNISFDFCGLFTGVEWPKVYAKYYKLT